MNVKKLVHCLIYIITITTFISWSYRSFTIFFFFYLKTSFMFVHKICPRNDFYSLQHEKMWSFKCNTLYNAQSSSCSSFPSALRIKIIFLFSNERCTDIKHELSFLEHEFICT